MVALSDIQQAKQRFGIIGNTPGLLRAVSRALQIAPTDLSVLITGESGTGKEFFPQIIHTNSHRKHGRYIAVNCGAIPEGTIDSELFGHEKGSFTGALADRKGYFEEADGGTIFLDEVGELPLTTQARLLRVLESGEFIKVGSSKVQPYLSNCLRYEIEWMIYSFCLENSQMILLKNTGCRRYN